MTEIGHFHEYAYRCQKTIFSFSLLNVVFWRRWQLLYRHALFSEGKLLEFAVVVSEYYDNENYFIYGRNPNLPEESILKVQGEELMQEINYRVGGLKDFQIQVFSSY